MKIMNGLNGVLAVLLVVASAAIGQQDKIEDQELLSLLDSVNQTPNVDEVASSGSVDEVETTVDAVGTVVDQEDELVVVGTVPADTNAVMDSLEIASDEEVVGSSEGNLISVRLNRVGLEEAINLFAQLSGANIIVPELTEAAQISVNLKDVEWRPALQSILDTYNYELYQRVSGSNVYSVRRRPEGAPEPQVVETFVLKYATVPNAAVLVRELLPPDAKISEFASRNMLVVKSTESSLGEVRAVLETIDTVRQQVFIESKFMELTDDAQKDLGIDWSVLGGYNVAAGNLSSRRTVQNDNSKTTQKFYDINGTQYETEESAPEPYFDGVSTNLFRSLIPTVTTVNEGMVSEISTAVLSADNFELMLSALAQKKGVNIVSNPKIIVANEEKANISIVRKEPNLKQERQQTAGAAGGASIDNTVFQLDPELPFFEYGIRLDVIPSINTSSNITVEIMPSLTRKFADKPAGQNTYPIIDEKSIKTIFNLSSGQTAAIGGLTELTEGEEEKKVPLLGSIPVLGRLFSWKQTVRGQDETIIFVTVGLANTDIMDESTGMPTDAELARRQIIRDVNSKKFRDQDREYFEAKEADKLDDMIKVIDEKEDERVERREEKLQKG